MHRITLATLGALATLAPTPAARSRPLNPYVEAQLITVHTRIHDAGAVTTIRARLQNASRHRNLEIVWPIPIPPGSAVTRSGMTLGGKKLPLQTLEKGEAASRYRAIVSKIQDPLLLRYLECGLVQANIFPVQPGQTAEVELTLVTTLPRRQGAWHLHLPLASFWNTLKRIKALSVRVELASSQPLAAVHSPTVGAELRRTSPRRVTLGWEAGAEGPRDVDLHFASRRDEFGLLPLVQPSAAGDRGTFMFTLSPGREAAAREAIPKAVTLVADTSGSMAGNRLSQVKQALRYFITHLNAGDSFNLVPFSTRARPLFPEPVPATAGNRRRALAAIAGLEAVGGTNLEDALKRGLVFPSGEHVPHLVLITDGQPSTGEMDPHKLLRLAEAARSREVRLFTFGIGGDLSTAVLDGLTAHGRGRRFYLGARDRLADRVEALLKAISQPALTNLTLRLEKGTLRDLTPPTLPDLYLGHTVTVLGRYVGQGEDTLIVEGVVKGRRGTWRYPLDLNPNRTGHDWLPPLWAQRRIAWLLDRIRTLGPDPNTVREITLLGRTYGIVTPYTSHLIAQGGRAPTPHGPVAASSRLDALMHATRFNPAALLAPLKADIRHVGGKVFVRSDGTWVDQDPTVVGSSTPRRILAFTPAWNRLLARHPHAGRWLAQDGPILLALDGTCYRIER